jgi:pyridoxine/pyridoxamine 5'-phosphate oxidase
VHESPAEIAALQELLDASFARASEHLTSIMAPQRRLSAEQLVADLTGIAVLNVATVTARGEPRISAVDGHFLHGRWHFTTDAASPKARQLAARPALSVSYTPRDGYGVFCHGRARLLERDTPEFSALHDHCVQTYGQSPDEWGGNIAYVQVQPSWMVGFAFTRKEDA